MPGFHAGKVENIVDNADELFAAAMDQLSIASLPIAQLPHHWVLQQLR